MPKKNEYIVVRRTHSVYIFNNQLRTGGFDWDEFQDTIRGYANMGFTAIGGVCISTVEDRVIVAQSMQYKGE